MVRTYERQLPKLNVEGSNPFGRSSELKKPMCGVKEFHYPKAWAPMPAPGTRGGGAIGFTFCAKLVFRKDDPYKCSCCVFRQFIRQASLTSIQSGEWVQDPYHIDVGEDGAMYGGAREDGSNGDSPDTGKEAGKWSRDGCTLKFNDSPHEGGPLLPPGADFELTYDFLGAVYDRCNNWRLVTAQRFILWSKGAFSEPRTEDEESVVDYEDYGCGANVPARAGWQRGRDGPLPGRKVPASDPDLPDEYEEQCK